MRFGLAIGLALSLATGAASHVAGAEPPLKLLTSSFWGTAEDDDLQGAAEAPDGTIYMVGNVGVAMKNLPGGVTPTVLGQPVAEPRCGRGFVAHLSADLTRVLRRQREWFSRPEKQVLDDLIEYLEFKMGRAMSGSRHLPATMSTDGTSTIRPATITEDPNHG